MYKKSLAAVAVVFVILIASLFGCSSIGEVKASRTWDMQIVSSNITLGKSAIALDPSGNPHILCQFYEGVKYASWTGSKWDVQPVDLTIVGSSSISLDLAIDNSGSPQAVYYDEANNCLKYAKLTNSSWNIQTVDIAGGVYCALALDSEGNPHMVYWDNLSQRLRYARWNGVFWSIETIDSGKWIGGDVYESLLGSSLAVDSRGNPHVSYVNVTGTPSGVEHSSLTHAFLELNPNNPTPTGTSVPIPTVGPSSSIPQTVQPTSSPEQSSDFLGTNIPVEYGYVMVTVGTIAVIAGVGLVYLRKIRK